jgi:hypothetical protein
MKSFYALVLLVTSFSSMAEYISSEKAKAWLKKNDRCEFSAGRIFPENNSDQYKSFLAMLKAKPGDVSQYSNPKRTPVLCIYNGTKGKGISQVSGCVMAYYIFERDAYEPFPNYIPSRRSHLPIVEDKKCTRDIIKNFLMTKLDGNGVYLIGELPSNVGRHVWDTYSKSQSTFNKEIIIFNDEFNVVDDLK